VSNCIFSTCVNYEPDIIFPFLKSCRNVFPGDIVVVTANLPEATLRLLKEAKVQIYPFSDSKRSDFLPQSERWKIFLDIILSNTIKFDRAFFTDISDVLFQSDPFEFDQSDYKLKLFLEERRINECEINSGWIKDAYGMKTLTEIEAGWISCSGTTLASYDGAKEYLEKIVSEFDDFKKRQVENNIEVSALSTPRGIDQAFHNYIYHRNTIKECTIVRNRMGEVQTMHHQTQFIFSNKGQILNVDGQICPILHQTNRFPTFLPALYEANHVTEGYRIIYNPKKTH
jgi:hypothetical protein